MRGRLQCYLWMGWDWMDGMVTIGRRSSKSTFGAYNNILDKNIKKNHEHMETAKSYFAQDEVAQYS